MIFRWIRAFFHQPYVSVPDGPLCPQCHRATELIELGSYRNQFFCAHCRRHYHPEAS